MPYVYSTLTASQAYTVWTKGVEGSLPRGTKIVEIKGGNGVADKNFITPRGVATMVTDEQLKALNECPAYIRHKKAGFISEDTKEVAPERKVVDMNAKDASAPKTPADFEKAPKVNKKSRGGEAE